MAREWLEDFEQWAHLRHHQTPAATVAASTTTEEHMTVFGEAKTILHDVVEKLETVDEAALGAVEAIKVNPTGVSIVNTVASIAHLPDPTGLLASLDVALKAVAAALQAAAAASAPAETPAQ